MTLNPVDPCWQDVQINSVCPLTGSLKLRLQIPQSNPGTWARERIYRHRTHAGNEEWDVFSDQWSTQWCSSKPHKRLPPTFISSYSFSPWMKAAFPTRAWLFTFPATCSGGVRPTCSKFSTLHCTTGRPICPSTPLWLRLCAGSSDESMAAPGSVEPQELYGVMLWKAIWQGSWVQSWFLTRQISTQGVCGKAAKLKSIKWKMAYV